MRFSLKLLFILAMAAGSVTAMPPLAAQETGFDEARVVSAIGDAQLRAVITRIGATITPLDEEKNALRIGYTNGARGIARRMACPPDIAPGEPCKGLLLIGYFAKPEGVDDARAMAAAMQFNREQNLASVAVSQRGEHVVKTYVIFDGGITLGNVAVQVALFGESVAAYQTLLFGGEN